MFSERDPLASTTAALAGKDGAIESNASIDDGSLHRQTDNIYPPQPGNMHSYGRYTAFPRTRCSIALRRRVTRVCLCLQAS